LTPVVVAVGSNIAPRRDTIDSGLRSLARLPRSRLLRRSRLHETAPVDAPPGSPPFLNGAALLHSDLDPRALLAEIQSVEDAHGRTRDVPNGPRTLDLDIVLYGDRILRERDLTIPHPRAHERLFVLEPAAEVAPHLVHPELGRSLARLLEELRARAASP